MRLQWLTVIVGVIAGVVLAGVQLSCGVVTQKTACADESCPAGPPGPAGAEGPPGPAGPSLAACRWLYTTCAPGANVECQQICPAGTHPISGSCDAQANATLTEHRASSGLPTFPPSPVDPADMDRWVCETSSGNMQFTYALCCPLA